jgi:type II secretory pathway component PulL
MKIGFVDWREEELHLYTFEKKGGQLTLEKSSTVPAGEELDRGSLAFFTDTGIHHVCLSLPVASLSLREVDFPFSDEEKISDTITFELEGLLLGDTDDYSIDHIITESFDDSSRVLAVCIEKSRLDKIIRVFESAGLELKVITSLDLRICGKNYEKILQGPSSDSKTRIESAKEELLDPSINLRRGEFSYTGDIDRLKKAYQLTAFLVLILLIIFGVNSALRYRAVDSDHKMLKSELEDSFRRAFPNDTKIVDVSRQFRGKVNILKKKRNVLGGVAVLDILADITDLTDKLATLDEFKADEKSIIIKGTVPSFGDVELLKNSLITRFGNVSVTESTSTTDNRISLTIVMKGKAV